MSNLVDGKDPEIAGAYERLGSAVAAPVDVLGRVEHRIRTRRRRRRVAVGAASVLAVAGIGTTAALVLPGGDQHSPAQAVDEPAAPAGPVSTLTITAADGSTYTFDDLTVSCRGAAGTPGEQIVARSPFRVEDNTLVEPYLELHAPLDEARRGVSYRLPVDHGPDASSMLLFVGTEPTRERGPGGGSSNAAGASGTVEITEASCGATPTLGLHVDATLGGELGSPPIPIEGDLRP